MSMRSGTRTRRPRSAWPPADSRGFTLTEVLAALLISVIAVMGLAHTFGIGRGLIDRYATGRDALAAANRRVETLRARAVKNSADVQVARGAYGPFPVILNGGTSGSEYWQVTWMDDPADNLASADTDGPDDYRRILVRVCWGQGAATDTLELSTVVYTNP